MSPVLTVVPPQGQKVCKRCNTAKPLSEFHKQRTNKFGVRSNCKDCRNTGTAHRVRKGTDTPYSDFISGGVKTCTRCGIEKKFSEFSKASWGRQGVTPDCKKCRNARYKDPRKNRKDRLPSKYGVDYVHVINTLRDQNGLCANRGCGKEIFLDIPMGPTRAVIDHDHSTGKFRAVLCMMCNMTLGKIENDQNVILGLMEYLAKHKIRN